MAAKIPRFHLILVISILWSDKAKMGSGKMYNVHELYTRT